MGRVKATAPGTSRCWVDAQKKRPALSLHLSDILFFADLTPFALPLNQIAAADVFLPRALSAVAITTHIPTRCSIGDKAICCR